MSDIDDELLALAGGDDYESDVEVSTSKRRVASGDDESEEDTVFSKRRKVDSDDEIGGRMEDGDDDQREEDKDGERERDDDEEDEDEGDYDPDAGYEPEEESELVNPYPLEGKYKDEQDRDELEEMDEMRREEILFERSQEMDKYNERKFLQQRIKQQQQQQQQQQQRSGDKLRTSSRTKTGGPRSDKENKLSELKKQRERHSRRRAQDEYEEESEEELNDSEEEEEEEGYGDEDEDDEYGGIGKNVAWGGPSKAKQKKSTELAKFEDIAKISVGRSVLANYCYHPNFSNIMIDTYSKVAVSVDRQTGKQIYRMVKIDQIGTRPEKPYRIGNSKFDTYLLVSQNSKQKMPFPMSTFSDSPITRAEYDKYIQQLDRAGEKIDLVDDVNDKYAELQKFYNTGLTDKDINERIARKQRIQQQEGNYSAFEAVQAKSRLMESLKIQKQRGNMDKVKSIIQELKQVDRILDQKTTSDLAQSQNQNIAKVNERNRLLNNKAIRAAEISYKKEASSATFDGGDPFSRLKTNTRMFYQDLINKENELAMKSVDMKKMIEEKTHAEEQIEKSTYRDLGRFEELIRSIDVAIDLRI
ncbi:uncharacterized protein LODBEIA_P59740 [Lodderomyces beijingensis]|uniref:Plus3 domain-containing protein n=1 Tax=Lodderomyces beijingensis TaxID=1775926 RepID=A0ABP0ZW08_9ASCO